MLPHLAHSFFGISEARGGFTSHGDAEKEEKKTSRRAQGPWKAESCMFLPHSVGQSIHVDKPRFKGGINTNRVKKRCHWCNLPLRPRNTRKR